MLLSLDRQAAERAAWENYWQTSGSSRCLPDSPGITSTTATLWRDFAQALPRSARLLDLGSGAGAVLEEISAHLLFDAKSPGSGKPFDWQLLKHQPFTKSWFLAGGLTPENVADAIRITGAPMVEVSSGIESAPGEKSLEKIAAFNAAVLNAKA